MDSKKKTSEPRADILPNEPIVSFRFVLVKANLNSDERVFSGVLFPRETQTIKLKDSQTSFKVQMQMDIEPEQGLEIEKVSAFFPIQSPADHDYLIFKRSGESWTAGTIFDVITGALPRAYRFSVRVQYSLLLSNNQREIRVENVDPMVVVGEVDKGVGLPDPTKAEGRSLFAHLR